MILVFVLYVQLPLTNAFAGVPSNGRYLHFGLSLHQHPSFVYGRITCTMTQRVKCKNRCKIYPSFKRVTEKHSKLLKLVCSFTHTYVEPVHENLVRACIALLSITMHALIKRGGWQGAGTPSLKNHKYIGVRSNTIPDPLKKSTKLPSQLSMLSHYRPASETPLKWRFASGPMVVCFLWYLDPLSPSSKKNAVKVELDPL